MDDTLIDNGRESSNELIKNLKGLIFSKSLIHWVPLQITIFAELQDQVNGVGRGYSIDKLNNVAMLEFFHDGNFGTERLLEIGISGDHSLLDFFDGNSFSWLIKSFIYFTKRALAQTMPLSVLILSYFF